MNDAKIIAVTQPLIESHKDLANNPVYMTPNEFIAYTARVSNPSNQHNTLTSEKLLKYLIEHKHWSPFEMVSITMEINTTRDISHQIIRHRSFSFQEFSQRYADPTKDMQFVTREARLQDAKNRQNSIETDDEHLQKSWKFWQEEIINDVVGVYNEAIEFGIAKEQARAILPEGLTSTRLYMSGTLRSWIHYIDVRAEEGTQKEHRQVALAAQEEILKHFPSLEEYWYPEPKDVVYAAPHETPCWTLKNTWGTNISEEELNKKWVETFGNKSPTDKPKSWWWKFWS
jgi:thymidylate synthase (FAD)